MRVLVVDDSEAVRSRLIARLREAGLEVVGQGGTAASAVSLAAVLRPDAVVLDVLLPDRHGLDVVSRLKATIASAVLLILSNATEYRRHCLALGADGFLDKSTDFDLVATTLVAVRLARRPAPRP